MEKVQIVSYSEKAIVVTGDTKPIKDLLKQAGGKFNARLTNPATKTSLTGWIFSKSRQNALESLLRGNNVKFSIELPANINSSNYRDYVADPAEIDADRFCQRNNM